MGMSYPGVFALAGHYVQTTEAAMTLYLSRFQVSFSDWCISFRNCADSASKNCLA
jgi:hypothetical protein